MRFLLGRWGVEPTERRRRVRAHPNHLLLFIKYIRQKNDTVTHPCSSMPRSVCWSRFTPWLNLLDLTVYRSAFNATLSPHAASDRRLKPQQQLRKASQTARGFNGWICARRGTRHRQKKLMVPELSRTMRTAPGANASGAVLVWGAGPWAPRRCPGGRCPGSRASTRPGRAPRTPSPPRTLQSGVIGTTALSIRGGPGPVNHPRKTTRQPCASLPPSSP